MRVLMVDDHVMFLQGLKSLLTVLAPEFSVDMADRISRAADMASTADYDLVLLDWHLGETTGEAAIAKLRAAGCIARVVVLSGETSPLLIRQVVELGAAGFISKQYSSENMVQALRVVLDGGIYLPPDALRDVASGRSPTTRASTGLVDVGKRFSELTPRQVDVYRAAARGLPNKLIARELGIAETTVKSHLSVVFGVLGVQNRTQAAYQASREGFRVG
jgi:DNA-binding NarL/FixJ family response regulator